VAAINGHRSGREVTHALVERAVSGQPGARLRSHVAAWCPGATGEQVEEAVQQACLLATRSCRGQSEGEVFAWLRTTARRELARSLQRGRREVPTDTGALRLLPGAGVAPAAEQELIEREDDREVDRVARAVVDRLSARQREIVALHVRGSKRPEIATQLGMTPRSVKRQLERIMTAGRAELVRLAGHGCESGEPLVARSRSGSPVRAMCATPSCISRPARAAACFTNGSDCGARRLRRCCLFQPSTRHAPASPSRRFSVPVTAS
jgi:RNA polymerase sigma factor (sigma-70 family)